MATTYAIISVGGKQYRVREGERLLVDRLSTGEASDRRGGGTGAGSGRAEGEGRAKGSAEGDRRRRAAARLRGLHGRRDRREVEAVEAGAARGRPAVRACARKAKGCDLRARGCDRSEEGDRRLMAHKKGLG